MILFLNFAPIEFMGGAEKWMLTTAKELNKKEKTEIISVGSSIANIYGSLVLKRKFDTRSSAINHPYSKIEIKSLIPFSKEWKKIHSKFKEAKLIYSRCEFQEMLLILYFSGTRGLKKTILGVHSPLIYKTPITFFDNLHNTLYSSFLNRLLLKNSFRVHVLNFRDKEYLTEKFKLNNVVYVPNGSSPATITDFKLSKEKENLNVIFIGELSTRKGADVLIDIAKSLPENISLTICGDGPMSESVRKIDKINVKYEGYVSKEKINTLFSEMDVLILPSRAESMPLSILEALSYGLLIVDSENITLDLDKNIEYSVEGFESKNYIKVLKLISQRKKGKKINKKEIKKYFLENFSQAKIDKRLHTEVFNISL